MGDIKTWTGERLETFIQNENTNEHLHRYAVCLELVVGKNVLDIACGDGYGSNLLSGLAANVTGVDIDEDTVTQAAQKYLKPNIKFLTGSADAIPCADSLFDVVVSFETIEHHDKHDEMMQEIRRVLRPGGLVIISSPDKLYYSDKTGYKNPFHVKELYAEEFEALLNKYFKNTLFFRQKSFFGSVVIPVVDKTKNDQIIMYQGGFSEIEPVDFGPDYVIGVASDDELPLIKISFYNGAAVLKHQFEVFHHLATEGVKATITFKVGRLILIPFKLIKKLLYGS